MKPQAPAPMVDKRPLGRRVLPALLAAAAVAAFLRSFFPHYMAYWDEVQLTLGLDRVDLISHHPHAPGYYLFILLGRALRPFFSDPADALRMVSALASGATVGLVGCLLPGNLRLGPRVLFLVSMAMAVVGSPILLPYGVLALTYASEALCWLAILLWLGRRPRGLELASLAAFIGVCGGLRQTLALWGLLLLVFWAVHERKRLRLSEVLVAGLSFLGGILVWFAPLLRETGGWDAYWLATSRLTQFTVAPRTVLHTGLTTLLTTRLPQMLKDLWAALGPFCLLAAAVAVGRGRSQARTQLARWDILPLGSGLAFLFYLFVIYDSSGYILPVAAPLAAYGILGAASIAAATGPRLRLPAILGPLVAAGILCVLSGGLASRDGGGYRQLLRNDETMARRIDVVRSQFDPDDTLLATTLNFWVWSFRHVMYYLPEFTTVQLLIDPSLAGARPGAPYLLGRDRKIRHVGPDPLDLGALPEFAGPTRLRRVVCMTPIGPAGCTDSSCAPFLRELPVGPDETLWVLEVDEAARVLVRHERLSCESRRSLSPP